MTAASVLTEALALIHSPNQWTKEAVAMDGKGKEVKPTDERAKRFDMVGAIQRVKSTPEDYGAAIRILRAQCGKESIFEFNDWHGHKAVLKVMRRAIAAAEVLQ